MSNDDAYKRASREEWAKDRRTLYFDEASDLRGTVSYALSDYASAEEIEDLRAGLKARRLIHKVGTYERRGINKALRLIKDNELPWLLDDCYGAQDIMKPFQARRKTVCDAVVEEAERKRAMRPMDDAAWEEELRYRKSVDDYFAHSPIIRSRTP
jgi:hypothetical protein